MKNRSRFGLALVTLAAFALRMVALDGVPARWDEGWSAAHALLPATDILWITGADVHPPLYYLMLGLWQQFIGVNLFANRYLSVLMALLAVPLVFHVALRLFGCWHHPANSPSSVPRRPAPALSSALLAAIFLAWLPLHVYYAQVVRMYALAPTFVLLAGVGALGLLHVRARAPSILQLAVGSAGAMLTLYHAAWALMALGVFVFVALLLQRNRAGVFALMGSVALALLLFAPWGVYAIPRLLGRAVDEATRNTNAATPILDLMQSGLLGLTMAGEMGWLPAGVLAGMVFLGAVFALLAKRAGGIARLSLPLLAIGFTLLGVALAARNWAFGARMIICATPAVALLLAWAFGQWPWALRGVGAIALAAVYAGISTNDVYAKQLEVFGEYSPHAVHERIAPRAMPDDVILVNVLSVGGFYLYDRVASPNASPTLSYALTWDPVIEPAAQWQARIRSLEDATRLTLSIRDYRHYRFWLVLYNGLYRDNGDLRGYMDSNYYPAIGEWGEDNTFYGLYGRPPDGWSAGATARWGQLLLARSNCPASQHPDDILPISLNWRAVAPLRHQYKVFVHALDETDAVVGQHDAMPLNDLRPFNTLPVGEFVRDNHGLLLDSGAVLASELRIVAGLYDPATGERVADDEGRTSVELCRVTIVTTY